MKQMKSLVTAVAVGAGLAVAGLQWTGNAASDSCPAGKPAEGECCAGSDSCCGETAGACPASLTQAQATAAYAVSGMSCGACETKLSEALVKVQGVVESTACAKTGLAKVSYNPGVAKKEQLLAAIQTSGFKLEGEVVELKVEGMECAACSGSVSKALTAVPGVKAQKVCAESKLATVTFDPAKTSREIIVAAIDKTGFKVVLP